MIFVLLFNVLMSLTFTFSKASLLYVSPTFLLTIRFLLASLILGVIGKIKDISWQVNENDYKDFFYVSAIPFYLSFVFDNWGLKFVYSSESSLIYNLMPVSTAIIGFFFI